MVEDIISTLPDDILATFSVFSKPNRQLPQAFFPIDGNISGIPFPLYTSTLK